MRRWAVAALALALSGSACAAPAPATSYTELLARPHAHPDARIAYGPAPDQFGELWLPHTHGPHPVAVLIHGGCWNASLPGLALMTPMAQALRNRGYAVWNIEYVRLGADGGGYPRTFTDVGAAVDQLRDLAPRYRLDLSHVLLVGHSAGGHLALWAAGRLRIPTTSALRVASPLPVAGVVSLAGIGDLVAFAQGGPGACGEAQAVPQLVGDRPDAYADTSPVALLPLKVRQAVVSGARDPIVPPTFGEAYAQAATGKGDPVRAVVVPDAGHFELIDPRASAWTTIAPLIDAMAK